jgi:hypothetical protein
MEDFTDKRKVYPGNEREAPEGMTGTDKREI